MWAEGDDGVEMDLWHNINAMGVGECSPACCILVVVLV